MLFKIMWVDGVGCGGMGNNARVDSCMIRDGDHTPFLRVHSLLQVMMIIMTMITVILLRIIIIMIITATTSYTT